MQTRIVLVALCLTVVMVIGATDRIAMGLAPTQVAPRHDDAGDDDRAFSRELGRRTLEGNCLMCHSVEMIETQRLTPEQWAAEVEKMVGWGAPVPPEETALLVAYLAESYATESDAPVFDRQTLDEARSSTRPEPDPNALPEGQTERGAAVFTEHCATCHGSDGFGGDLGVSLIARPVLLRPVDYAEILRNGRHRMPGFQIVLSDQQVADTLAWLQDQSR
ncbi:c-type cytochrome [Tautonia rosea]|uniref:c-type cytochrome n=1 Tax=Tautonia rosea TaxID=2728037 RepID=UPI0014727689|nr:cytochrome c [Tautonia rosea]